MPSTEIILTENVPGLGAEADLVKVRRGYARNYLLPSGKAYEVTPASLRQLDNLKKKRAEREARELNEAEVASDLHPGHRRDGQGVRIGHRARHRDAAQERTWPGDRPPQNRAGAADQGHRRTRSHNQVAPRRVCAI